MLCSTLQGVWGFKLRSLRFQGKHFTHQAAPDNVNSQHPLGTASIQPRSQERKASQGFCLTLIHPLFRIATPPHPTIALVLLTVLCDSAGLHPTILHPPLPMCLPLCPAVWSGPVRPCPWVQRPREADRGARHLHSTSRGCSDLTCNSSDKSLSAMPMAESVATLFVLISSEQISSSQRLAGSYRFLINVGTDFSRLGPGWGVGLGWKWRTGRRERCWPEADEENAGRITSGL